jgi:hypothetical protein
MGLHGLLSVTIGVPNAGETGAYYADFGLTPEDDGWFSTTDAGRQLRIVPAPTRRLVEMRVGVDDPDDLTRAAASLELLGVAASLSGMSLQAAEPVTGTRVFLDVAPRIQQKQAAAEVYNGPGRSGTSGGSDGTTRGPTSSGISRIRRATSRSTTQTWTASWTTSCGPRKTSKARAACSPGDRRRPRPSSTPRTSRP